MRAFPRMMQVITLCYTQYFSRKNSRTGRLWECRYNLTIVDEERYLWAVSKYIEINAVRAGIAGKPEAYPYSSYEAHLLGKSNTILMEELFGERELNKNRRFMKMKEDERILEEIRKQTRLGKPFGEGEFLQILSKQLSHEMIFRSKGRPRKVSGQKMECIPISQSYIKQTIAQ